MCTYSALCINRAVTIEAEVPGSVELGSTSHNSRRRVFWVQSSGVATLIGLNITGGYVASAGWGFGDWGGGVYIQGTATLNDCNIHGNTAGHNGNGGGLVIFGSGATAALTNCNIYENSPFLSGKLVC